MPIISMNLFQAQTLKFLHSNIENMTLETLTLDIERFGTVTLDIDSRHNTRSGPPYL